MCAVGVAFPRLQELTLVHVSCIAKAYNYYYDHAIMLGPLFLPLKKISSLRKVRGGSLGIPCYCWVYHIALRVECISALYACAQVMGR